MGRPGGSGEPSGGVRGDPGGVLEGPGGSRGGLGRVLSGLGVILGRPFEQSDFDLILGSVLNAKGRKKGAIWRGRMKPKSIPKQSKIEVDFQERKNVQSVSWDPLEAILGHF